MDTLHLNGYNPFDDGVKKAAELLRDGKIVAIPTETVYGLAANAFDADAIVRVFKAKGRPQDNPLIVHISDFSELEPLVTEIPETAVKLAEAYWPGPLTMVLPKSDLLPDCVSAGLDTVAVRMPSNPVAREVIRLSGCPLAAPSANLSGRPSTTTAQHVIHDLDGKIDAVIVDMEPAKNIVAANPKLKIQESIKYDPEDYAIAVKKGNTELLGLIDVVLTEIKSDGSYDNLVKGFIDTPQDQRDAYITGEQVGTEGTLTVGTNAEFPPFEYTLDDGSVVGLDIELAKLIAKKANKTLVVKNTMFDSLLLELENGSVDFVIAGMTVTEERLAQVDFSASYYTSEQAVIVRAD